MDENITANFYTAFNELLSSKNDREQRVLITAHFNPDGDALGSALGLYWFFKRYGIPATVLMPNVFPDFLKWMPGVDEVCIFENQKEEGLSLINQATSIFFLDFNTLSRCGDGLCEPLAQAEAQKFMIDHHLSPSDCADYIFSDASQPSTSQMVLKLLSDKQMHELLGKEGAACLFTGIITDTGSFRFPLVSAETFYLTGKLLDMGIKHTEIYEHVYDAFDERRFRLLGNMLSQMQTFGSTVVLHLTQGQQQQEQMKKGDTEGFVNYGLNLKGKKLAVFIREDDDFIRMSFRSKGDIDVNTFARTYFNGGGHLNAAGGNSYDSLGDTISRFKKAVAEFFPELI
jgi:bifunctional oligoribonuclease and PAP phosphatase NrnA